MAKKRGDVRQLIELACTECGSELITVKKIEGTTLIGLSGTNSALVADPTSFIGRLGN